MTAKLEIPKGARVEGLIESDTDIVVEGHLEGMVDTAGTLKVARGGNCKATVRAKRVRIVGQVIGNITASELVDVAAGARVVGDVRAPDISIDASAVVDGRVDLLAPGPETKPLDRMELSPAQLSGWKPMRPQPPVSAAPHSASLGNTTREYLKSTPRGTDSSANIPPAKDVD